MDRLSEFLDRNVFNATVFFDGRFCGDNHFPGANGLGQLHVVRSGTVVMHHSNRPSIHIDEPAVLFYPRGLEHHLVVPPGSEVSLVCANLSLENEDDHAPTAPLPDCLHVRLADAPLLNYTLELLDNEARGQFSGRRLVLNRLCEVLVVQLLRHAHATGQLELDALSGLSDPGLARVLEAVRRQPAQPWPLDALARMAGMSRSRFASHFHKEIGMPPAEYIAQRRMKLAQLLLRQRLPVEQVAIRVGYQSQPAFSRAFIARFGISPSAWLRSRPDQPGVAA
ncbi:MAG: helix-turn-helix domain-containing protein [Burkholderiaceae bacterium]